MDSPELLIFKKLETLLADRGLEFTAPMRYKYWNEPMYRALFYLIAELFERSEPTSTWNPWDDF